MKFEEKKIFSEQIFAGKVVFLSRDTVSLSNGNETVREVIKHPGGACIAALTDNDEIIFVEQFRYPQKTSMFEIPAGKLEENENPAICARRELLEETGFEAEEWTYLGKILPTPAYCSEVIHIFMATGLIKKEQKLEKDELLEVRKVPLSKAYKMAMKGELQDAKTVTAILKIYAYMHGGYNLPEDDITPPELLPPIEENEES